MSDDTTTTVRLSRATKQRVQDLAARERRSLARQLGMLVEEGLGAREARQREEELRAAGWPPPQAPFVSVDAGLSWQGPDVVASLNEFVNRSGFDYGNEALTREEFDNGMVQYSGPSGSPRFLIPLAMEAHLKAFADRPDPGQTIGEFFLSPREKA